LGRREPTLVGLGFPLTGQRGFHLGHKLLNFCGVNDMKDLNDNNQTIDWVDEVEVVSKEVATPDLGFHITENERKFLENLQDPDACAWLISAWGNMSHSVALNTIIDRTINDIINNTTEQ